MLDFWQSLWHSGHTPWDLRGASPPLCEYCARIPPERRNGPVLIPGCGNGYEALFLLEQGFTAITMLDIAPGAVAALTKRLDEAGPSDWKARLRVICGDFFAHEGSYDLILEQTFFCALTPELRPDYVRQMHRLLRPGGRLAGVWFDREFEGGPPFGGSRAEYEALFRPYFRIKTLAPCYNSIAPRAGTELFAVLEKPA